MELFDGKLRVKDQLVKVVDIEAKTRLFFEYLQKFSTIEKPMEIVTVKGVSTACLCGAKSVHPSTLSQRSFQHFSYHPSLFVWENLREIFANFVDFFDLCLKIHCLNLSYL